MEDGAVAKEGYHPLFHRFDVSQLAFPNCQHAPAQLLSRRPVPAVAQYGFQALFTPKGGIGLWHNLSITAAVRVPETSVHEDHGS